ncbi:hypothetical protein [Brevifollis gellanilyticus]|uniref:Uncharacterized protein n=1 Tax=Brevifollis gellanilyticus TaxID=748831 RepID=A0A512MAC6_9BACT|nr:hypothetical protein [Brevifollis gellanilyticus]GEP43687.1 hypothetical protein BGE01nite_29780 [Brevifollis gellanilyticus]
MIKDTFAETSRPLTSDEAPDAVQTAVDATRTCVQDTLAHTGHYVRSHPVPVLLGALAFGVAVGCALAVGSRREETLREKLSDQKLSKFRDALLEALQPVSAHLKDDYASVQNCVDKTFSNGSHTLAAQLGRFGRNLKFW